MADVPTWPPTSAENRTRTCRRRPHDRTGEGSFWFDSHPSPCRSAAELLSLLVREQFGFPASPVINDLRIHLHCRGGGGMWGSLAAWKQHKQQNFHLGSVYANQDKLMLIYRKERGKLASRLPVATLIRPNR